MTLEDWNESVAAMWNDTALDDEQRLERMRALAAQAPHPALGDAPAVFLALALHSAGRPEEALRVAIETIEPGLPRYHRSVRAYAAALTADAPNGEGNGS